MTFIKDESLKIYFIKKFFVIPYKIGYNWIFYYLFLQKRDNNKFPFKVPFVFLKDINFIPEIYMNVHYMNIL